MRVIFAQPVHIQKGRDGTNPLAVLRENMTVIAASRADEGAIEAGGGGGTDYCYGELL